MKVLKTIEEVKIEVRNAKRENKGIGLVPTMGYLHQGHGALMQAAKEKCEYVIVSIFVNPIQFGEGEDFEHYPRDLEKDSQFSSEMGVDAIFAPDVKEIYPNGQLTFVGVNTLTDVMCGASRPSHFSGVTTVVTKLFNIVEPDYAFFGQKDAQQLLVVKKMVEDLNVNVKIEGVPIVREKDGLALSSRNVYLSVEERKAALVLSKTLYWAKKEIEAGYKEVQSLHSQIIKKIQQEPLAKIDYVEIRRLNDLSLAIDFDSPIIIALAVKFGTTRLIDNVMIENK